MDCRTADKMIIRYIQRELDDDETAAFLKHIRTCQSCRNELEINYDIIDCLKALDSPGRTSRSEPAWSRRSALPTSISGPCAFSGSSTMR